MSKNRKWWVRPEHFEVYPFDTIGLKMVKTGARNNGFEGPKLPDVKYLDRRL